MWALAPSSLTRCKQQSSPPVAQWKVWTCQVSNEGWQQRTACQALFCCVITGAVPVLACLGKVSAAAATAWLCAQKPAVLCQAEWSQQATAAAASGVRHTESPWLPSACLVNPADNLLTDSAVFDLVELLQSLPSAQQLSHLDLSHNQLLSWQCCGALRQLLSAAASRAAATAAVAAAAAQASGGVSTESSDQGHTQQAPNPATAHTSSSSSTAQAGAGHVGSENPGGRQPIGWNGPQLSLRRLAQPLQLQVLLLQSVSIGDKGAVLLSQALAGTQDLRVSVALLARGLSTDCSAWTRAACLCCLRLLLCTAGAKQQVPQQTLSFGYVVVGQICARQE